VSGVAGADRENVPNPSDLAMIPPRITDYKLTALERDLLQYTKVIDNGHEQPYTGEIPELCPHLKAATAMAIRKTLQKSPNGHRAQNMKLQLKGLEVDISKAIMDLKEERRLLGIGLPHDLQCCEALTLNPWWKHCFGRYVSFRKKTLQDFEKSMVKIDERIVELEAGLKELD
jgi:hypothetical protein